MVTSALHRKFSDMIESMVCNHHRLQRIVETTAGAAGEMAKLCAYATSWFNDNRAIRRGFRGSWPRGKCWLRSPEDCEAVLYPHTPALITSSADCCWRFPLTESADDIADNWWWYTFIIRHLYPMFFSWCKRSIIGAHRSHRQSWKF